jgi:hypothetical protein
MPVELKKMTIYDDGNWSSWRHLTVSLSNQRDEARALMTATHGLITCSSCCASKKHPWQIAPLAVQLGHLKVIGQTTFWLIVIVALPFILLIGWLLG